MSGDRTYAAAAWRWAQWYGSAMDANGYVTDYDVTPGGLVTTGDYDSTDAYSGMFLVAVDAISNASPDAVRLRATRTQGRARGRSDPLDAARRRADRRQAQLDGGLPHERGRGVRGPPRGEPISRARWATARWPAARTPRPIALSAGVERLWNADAGALDWAVHPSGDHVTTNWSQLYPDALSQLWAVEYGLVRGPLATAVSSRSRVPTPAPPTPPLPTSSTAPSDPGGYWPGAGLALATVDQSAPARFLAGTARRPR